MHNQTLPTEVHEHDHTYQDKDFLDQIKVQMGNRDLTSITAMTTQAEGTHKYKGATSRSSDRGKLLRPLNRARSLAELHTMSRSLDKV